MRRMAFMRPVFHPGLNFTVRLGEEWADLKVGEIIELDGPCWCLGFVTHVIKCHLGEIPEFVREKEHDPDCRTLDGLIAVLREVYPELREREGEGIESEVVTCVGFRVFVSLGGEEQVLPKART